MSSGDNQITRELRVELMLRRLQAEIERTAATGEQRRRRRAMLRGFRSALWATQAKAGILELGMLLREELELPVMKPNCANSGTDEEVTK